MAPLLLISVPVPDLHVYNKHKLRETEREMLTVQAALNT